MELVDLHCGCSAGIWSVCVWIRSCIVCLLKVTSLIRDWMLTVISCCRTCRSTSTRTMNASRRSCWRGIVNSARRLHEPVTSALATSPQQAVTYLFYSPSSQLLFIYPLYDHLQCLLLCQVLCCLGIRSIQCRSDQTFHRCHDFIMLWCVRSCWCYYCYYY